MALYVSRDMNLELIKAENEEDRLVVDESTWHIIKNEDVWISILSKTNL